jgi:hypothetical protein
MPDLQNADEKKSTLEVFVSYAREDLSLVREIADELKRPFGYPLHFFIDDRSIEDGDEWRNKINDALDRADILLIVSTGQRKESHSFTGYEVGWFSNSKKIRPTSGVVKRQIIPLVIGDRPPIAVAEIQGIIIPKENVFNLQVKPGDLSTEGKFMQIAAASNPCQKILIHFRNILRDLLNIPNNELDDLNANIEECAARLYKKIFAYLRGRVYRELYPERKIIIRTAVPPGSTDEEAMLNNSTIDLVGDSIGMFGFLDHPANLPWQSFVSLISPKDLATQWQDAIRTLVSDAFNGIPIENYSFVRSPQTGQSFRLFVSLTRTYYSEQQEVHIYIVEVAPPSEYGDTLTTKLAKAVDLGLRYRSLFLEQKSPFSPPIVRIIFDKEKLRKTVKDMWRELQHLLTEMRQSKLDDPELVIAIYGNDPHEDLDALARIWTQAEAGLSKLTHDFMAAPDDQIMAMKGAVLTALREFCDKTERMNQEYTARALRALEEQITLDNRALPTAPPTPAPAKAASP